jgi:hypothetical protein
MKEDFLHYLWQYQVFDKNQLMTTQSELLSIEKIGFHNQNSGPDFLHGQLIIAGQKWSGHVEIHLKSSDWYVHGHEQDKAYDNVILHVVWEDDMPVFRKNKTLVSTLELKGLVPKPVLESYNLLFQKKTSWIACETSLPYLDSFVITNWLERLYIERLEEKSIKIESLLKGNNNDWEAVLYVLLLKNFGLIVNGEAFFELAQILDYTTIRKQHDKSLKIEALLFGSAGLLDTGEEDEYRMTLREQYAYLKQKHQLGNATSHVQFFRLRPPNFPTIRLSQFANLYATKPQLFQEMMSATSLEEMYVLLNVKSSVYWETHYSFGKKGKKRTKNTTKSFIDLLIINTIIPLRFVYSRKITQTDLEALLAIMHQVPPEKNRVINKFSELDIKAENAMESQALLQLNNNYCKPQRCLDCRLGLSILNKN